jgi:7,8-dihydropterin-6-yl-methyl-4-(beta-D-ribofuranosyl)aminobenzene 5'-phosphate synthase
MIGRHAQFAAGMALVVASLGGGRAQPAPSPPASPPAVQAGALRITVLYDNTAADARFQEAWGFAALIEYRGHTLLMDAGGDPRILRRNLDSLGIAPSRIEAIVLTHAHSDHAAGLQALADSGVRRPLYLLGATPQALQELIRNLTGGTLTLVEAAPRQELIPGVFTTGEMMDPAVRIPEQSLVIPTDSGLVVVTGCAHQGVVGVVRRATEMFSGPVRLVLGGFHLGNKSAAEIGQVVSDFRALGVRRVGATHCTGDLAIAQFAEAYGSDYVRLGAGRVLVLAD